MKITKSIETIVVLNDKDREILSHILSRMIDGYPGSNPNENYAVCMGLDEEHINFILELERI
jgi:hypothetical protein